MLSRSVRLAMFAVRAVLVAVLAMLSRKSASRPPPSGFAHTSIRSPLLALVLRTSMPGLPAHAWLIAIASGFAITGQSRESVASSLRSKPRMRGDDEMTHAPKCARSSSSVMPFPTCSMSGYAHRPGRLIG
eukprot:2173117-Prymnesium_polylepis.2